MHAHVDLQNVFFSFRVRSRALKKRHLHLYHCETLTHPWRLNGEPIVNFLRKRKMNVFSRNLEKLEMPYTL